MAWEIDMDCTGVEQDRPAKVSGGLAGALATLRITTYKGMIEKSQ